MSSRPFLCILNMYYYQQRCAYIISKQKPKQFLNPPIIMCSQNMPHTFSLLAAIHLFISSHNEIEEFCSMDKKTGRRYLRRVRIFT